jgi:hypothetical protein
LLDAELTQRLLERGRGDASFLRNLPKLRDRHLRREARVQLDSSREDAVRLVLGNHAFNR